MGRKKKRSPDNPEQSARFIALAKEVDTSKEEFEEAFEKIVKAKPKPKKSSNKGST